MVVVGGVECDASKGDRSFCGPFLACFAATIAVPRRKCCASQFQKAWPPLLDVG